MACGAIRSWTLPSLVAAYLDLALAYLFLCAAAFAFLASKFLALFGLALPCSCRSGPRCLYSLIADFPARKITCVHVAVRGRFPLNSASHRRRRHCCCYDAKLESDDDVKGYDLGVAIRGLLEMGGGQGGEQSCGSVSKPSASSNLSLPAPGQPDGAESGSYFCRGQMGVDEGKEILRAETPPPVLHYRRRRKNSLVIRRKSPPPSLAPPLQFRWDSGAAAAGTPPVFTEAGDRLSGNQIDLVERVASITERKSVEKDLCIGAKQVCGSKENDSTTIRDLERALEEERSARAALYLELEKERSAAATAANEAMAMILRLQEEKAAIEMEAWQFHRMVEEKSAYDEEEMEILKEIILRREREKHVLEKEVEAYRVMMLNGGDAQQPLENYQNCLSVDLSQDPELELSEIYKTIEKTEMMKEKMQQFDDSGHLAAKKQNSIPRFDNRPLPFCIAEDAGYDDVTQGHSMEMLHLNTPDHEDECDVQDKSMVTTEVLPSFLQQERSGYEELNKLGKSGEIDIHESTPRSNDEEDGARNMKFKTEVPLSDLFMRHAQNTVKTCSYSSQLESGACVLDVHVIDDKTDLGRNGKVEQVEISHMGYGLGMFHEYNVTNEPSTTSTVDPSTPDTRCRSVELNIHRSHSDMPKEERSMVGSCQRASWVDLRRRSMSAVDSERFKLENEVELLRKRLKLIQQGREKLNLSAEHRDKESNHLQLLEEIACQLQEIRKATGPRTSTRQSSLPPSSSKVNLRKRRHSVSGAPHGMLLSRG